MFLGFLVCVVTPAERLEVFEFYIYFCFSVWHLRELRNKRYGVGLRVWNFCSIFRWIFRLFFCPWICLIKYVLCFIFGFAGTRIDELQ